MAEEFQECEVVFQQEHIVEGKECDLEYRRFKNINNGGRATKRKKLMKDSMNTGLSIPVQTPNGKQWFEYEVDPDVFLPPHLILRQRLGGEMTGFSVCIGEGRTLKGRDLSQVRNSILRMTGFLES